MLAASKLGSNVPPNNLQAAPVMALTGITPNQLKKILAIGALKSQPAQISQQHTARLQCRRHPFLIAIKDLCGSAGVDSNARTGVESSLQIGELKVSGRDPDETSCSPKYGIEIKHQNKDQTRRDEQSS